MQRIDRVLTADPCKKCTVECEVFQKFIKGSQIILEVQLLKKWEIFEKKGNKILFHS